MADQPKRPQGVHLVGSIPCETNTAAFTLAISVLGKYLRRIPDGETGVRSNWITWQMPILSRIPQFETITTSGGAYRSSTSRSMLKLRAGAAAEDVAFPKLGYSDAALASYAEFSRLKREGAIDEAVRFQVCLPTPLAVIHSRFVPEAQAIVEPLYETKLVEELGEIQTAIPPDELAIQWDTAIEFALLEGILNTYLDNMEADILARLVRLGTHVAAEAQLGYHLCYGDAGHQHFTEPADTSKLVRIANGIAAELAHPLHWMHLPVPRSRTDLAYFAPLRDLKLRPETELYLGLVHFTDGAGGTQDRIQAAQQVVANFGVATECGFGRREPATIPDLMDIHRKVAEPVW